MATDDLKLQIRGKRIVCEPHLVDGRMVPLGHADLAQMTWWCSVEGGPFLRTGIDAAAYPYEAALRDRLERWIMSHHPELLN